jgi:LDH2 family malate/lactate/ureidoglycolate dehydrogenase
LIQLMSSKLEVGNRQLVPVKEITRLVSSVFQKVGCDTDIAEFVANHLVESNLKGVESHGVMRMIQYVEQLESGYMIASGRPSLSQNEKGSWIVNGHGGFGMPALQLGMEKGIEVAKENGISIVAVVHCGHTGRLGAFAEKGAEAGCLTIWVGGGGHKDWPQVTPHGGAKGMLPTNPFAFGIPGGKRGPVVLDFSTARIAGGWIYAAKSAGVLLPEGVVVDANAEPTRNPDDYFNGGAILPMAGAKGYGLALLAELIGAAMLGPVTTEMNWLCVCIDTALYSDGQKYQEVAEEILQELRSCPPVSGVEKVEIPGEREREFQSQNLKKGVAIPEQTWNQMMNLVNRLKVQF